MKHKWWIPLLALVCVVLFSAIRAEKEAKLRRAPSVPVMAQAETLSYTVRRQNAKETIFRLDARACPPFLDRLVCAPLDGEEAEKLLGIPREVFALCVSDAFTSNTEGHTCAVLFCESSKDADAICGELVRNGFSSVPGRGCESSGCAVLAVISDEKTAKTYLSLFPDAIIS